LANIGYASVIKLGYPIYNRWGELVYEGKEAWNGSSKNSGGELPEGVFVYLINLETRGGDMRFLEGTVLLMR